MGVLTNEGGEFRPGEERFGVHARGYGVECLFGRKNKSGRVYVAIGDVSVSDHDAFSRPRRISTE